MEDTATAEISRSQIWQWVRHGRVDAEHVRALAKEEVETLRSEEGWSRVEEAAELFEQVALGQELAEFLTLPAYELLD
jgi:malate synthase